MRLPQELIDWIIDELGFREGVSDPECRAALKTCSLTSSSFLTRSRKHLFAQVRIEERRNNQDLKGPLDPTGVLDVLVEDNRINPTRQNIPPLASHIRCLSIILCPSDAYPKKLDPNSPSDLHKILKILIPGSPITSFSLGFPTGTHIAIHYHP
ncbi:hypothetical protein M413DRAFT_26839 [Hebeloma cylindrosporum]|uniref:Uncharacterized protein n=1 Tax=Hebeloma cylindrosporum TaxID=76867 RepID=A0A0C3CF88_HEBCY|nr:hypothetical protein M413DRAFT_26839 [Hebeloma cylindrosporum h7]